jgi:hypothetical protein
MPKVKAKKVFTPGSKPTGKAGLSPRRGRPMKEKKKRSGLSRKDNYRTKYLLENIAAAVESILI